MILRNAETSSVMAKPQKRARRGRGYLCSLMNFLALMASGELG